jgi:hypothetical protein
MFRQLRPITRLLAQFGNRASEEGAARRSGPTLGLEADLFRPLQLDLILHAILAHGSE